MGNMSEKQTSTWGTGLTVCAFVCMKSAALRKACHVTRGRYSTCDDVRKMTLVLEGEQMLVQEEDDDDADDDDDDDGQP
ncbi:hypothetical protein MUK42_35299 [Musa troglodytarum]|uniref:Uncharacterized protein n=1 Tax=Musa troglodytarum TaxID=320322 RepID=A0A9E7J903_9LILI|nr:hypothetical protein MUK42_35299 [Musa troglodytarum]